MLTTEQCIDALPYVADIVEKLEIMEEYEKLRGDKKTPRTKADIEKAGLNFILFVVKNSSKCKESFFGLMAILMDCTPEEAKEKPPAESVRVLKEIFDDKELFDFFKQAV